MNEQEILNETADLMAETLDTIENTLDIMETGVKVVTKTNPWLLVGVGVVSFAAGAAISYWATKKTAMALFEETLEEEIMRAQQYFDRLHKEGDFASPADAVEALIPEDERTVEVTAESLREEYETGRRPEDAAMKVDYTKPGKDKAAKKAKRKGTEVTEEEEGVAADEVRIAHSIWVNDRPIGDGGWDYDSVERSEDDPFIISEEEFFESAAAGDFDATQLTFYSLDETLADASDDEVPSDRVGPENLKMFGKFPGADPNILYIKNETLKRVYEVAYSEGGFKNEVQGFGYTEEEQKKMARRIRGDDD